MIVLTLAGFMVSVTGLSFSLHVHLWHTQHGDHSQHDNDHCPVYKQMMSVSQSILSEAPSFSVELILGHRICGTEPQVQLPTFVQTDFAPRAPPLLTAC
jgi:hypothetical protein